MAKLSVRQWLVVLLLPAALCLLPACGESDRDETAPFISLTTDLKEVTPRQEATVDLVGTIDEDATLEVRLNDSLVSGFTVGGGDWSGTIADLRDGSNEIALTAIDRAENTNTIRIIIVRTEGPIVTAPIDGSDAMPREALTITFNEALDATTVDPANFTLTGPNGLLVEWALDTYVPGTFDVVFRPTAPFAANTTYKAAIGTGLKDAVGNPAVAQSFTFTTGP